MFSFPTSFPDWMSFDPEQMLAAATVFPIPPPPPVDKPAPVLGFVCMLWYYLTTAKFPS